jgi:hypothetical protein
MKKKIILVVLVLVTVACSCGLPVDLLTQTTQESTKEAGSSIDSTTGELSSDVSAQMDEIEQQVQQLRGLQAASPLNRTVITTDELNDIVINDFFSDYTADEAADDVRELALIGLLPEGFDLYQFYVDLYTEQIAGFYDPEVQTMYVVGDEAFDGLQRMTYAHEYTHALQDQTWDMENGLNVNDENCRLDTEYCAGVQSLIEGDATLTEQLWFITNATEEDRQQVLEFYGSYSSPVYDSAPLYMQQDFLFPYSQGLEFVNSLYEQGGFSVIDADYSNPPVSTEQILHPERYPSDIPVTVNMPDMSMVIPSDYRQVTENVMGEWYTYLILSYGNDPSYRIDDDQARAAAEGWGGDTYRFFYNDQTGDSVYTQKYTWDTESDASAFWNAITGYAQLRWGSPVRQSDSYYLWEDTSYGSVILFRYGWFTYWVMAPTTEMADAILSIMQ